MSHWTPTAQATASTTRGTRSDAVPSGLDDPTLVIGDFGVDQVASKRSQTSQCARFILTHQTTATDDIGGQDDHKASVYACFAHLRAGLKVHFNLE